MLTHLHVTTSISGHIFSKSRNFDFGLVASTKDIHEDSCNFYFILGGTLMSSLKVQPRITM